MAPLEIALACVTLAGLSVGGFSISLCRAEQQSIRCTFGRCLAFLALLSLGGAGLFAALTRSAGLVPLGLLVGLLVVMMLWETPELENPSSRG